MRPPSDPDQRHAGAPPALATAPNGLAPINAALLQDVSVTLSVKLGDVTLSVGDVMALKSGAVVKLDSALNDPIDICLNGAPIARGEIVAVEDHFAVRILEVADR